MEPRLGKINLNANEKFYTEEQKAYVLRTCKEYINFFGYAKCEGRTDPHAFFDYHNLNQSELDKNAAYETMNAE